MSKTAHPPTAFLPIWVDGRTPISALITEVAPGRIRASINTGPTGLAGTDLGEHRSLAQIVRAALDALARFIASADLREAVSSHLRVCGVHDPAGDYARQLVQRLAAEGVRGSAAASARLAELDLEGRSAA